MKTVLKETVYRKHPAVSNIEHLTITLIGLGNITIKSLGFCFSTDIMIINSSYETIIYVVPD